MAYTWDLTCPEMAHCIERLEERIIEGLAGWELIPGREPSATKHKDGQWLKWSRSSFGDAAGGRREGGRGGE